MSVLLLSICLSLRLKIGIRLQDHGYRIALALEFKDFFLMFVSLNDIIQVSPSDGPK